MCFLFSGLGGLTDDELKVCRLASGDKAVIVVVYDVLCVCCVCVCVGV